MQQKSERVTMVKKSDCHSKIVTVDRYDYYTNPMLIPNQSLPIRFGLEPCTTCTDTAGG